MTAAERIERTQVLIARLKAELAAGRQAGEAAREARARVALAAAEGDESARAELEGATATAARSIVTVENTELALVAARERLAALETQAEAERLARERLEALALCQERHAAAGRVDQALAELWAAVQAWQATTPRLLAYRRGGQTWLPDNPNVGYLLPPAVAHVAYGFATFLGLRYVTHDEVAPLADEDPYVLWARREAGETVDTRFRTLRKPREAPPVALVPDDPDPEDDPPAVLAAAPIPDDGEDAEDDAAIGFGIPDRAA